MNAEKAQMLNELECILTAISIDSEEVIEETANIIQKWMLNTRYVKGYCRT